MYPRFKFHSLSSATKIYSLVLVLITRIITVSLLVSVNTEPRSAPLRLFFFCWVSYSVAIITGLQPHLTTFLIKLRYEESVKSVEQILRYKKKFRVPERKVIFLTGSSESVESAIFKNALPFPNEDTHFKVALYLHCLSCFSPSISQYQNHTPVKPLATLHSTVPITNHTTVWKVTDLSAACHSTFHNGA